MGTTDGSLTRDLREEALSMQLFHQLFPTEQRYRIDDEYLGRLPAFATGVWTEMAGQSRVFRCVSLA